jgi:Cu(I)/Ag(I) efflux system membrane fusion protein
MNEPSPSASAWRWPLHAAAVAFARLRMIVVAGTFLAVIAAWPFLQAHWEKLTRSASADASISSNTEYWCPMCPGVVTDWPSKCPVCSMSLVRREKGDMTPLPNGVVARVQLSPERIQLAGIRTAPVEFRRLEHDVVVAGLIESSAVPGFAGEVFEHDALLLTAGQAGSASCDARPGEALDARIAEVAPAVSPGRSRTVRVRLPNIPAELRPGTFVSARFRTPVSRTDSFKRGELDRWPERLALGSTATAFPALVDAGVRSALADKGWVLSIPESAVIHTGTRQVVYSETMPGMFDAVEVSLGRRCGDHYPVRSGLEPGQRVAAAGSVLLDAETRLNPSLAAAYFGSKPRESSPAPAPQVPASDDRLLAERQKICPVTEKPLDSMGGPVKLQVDGRVVFICCKGCEGRLRAKSGEYLKSLPK